MQTGKIEGYIRCVPKVNNLLKITRKIVNGERKLATATA
jgi:hypothetical protein